jgi:hypothetical protein
MFRKELFRVEVASGIIGAVILGFAVGGSVFNIVLGAACGYILLSTVGGFVFTWVNERIPYALDTEARQKVYESREYPIAKSKTEEPEDPFEADEKEWRKELD